MIYTYVYYKIAPEKFSKAQHTLLLFLEEVHTSIGFQPQILKRQDDPCTWMEVYTHPTPNPELPAILMRLAQKSGLAECLIGPRHVECFVPNSI